jgi:Zn-dependent protease
MSILVPVMLYLLHAPVFGGAKPVPINKYNLKWHEWGMALVALAGPLTNILITLIGFLVGHFTGILYGYGGEILFFALRELVLINIGFAVFNLIPIPPLDGSRVLYAISPDGFRNILTSIEPYGFILVYLLIVLFGNTFSSVMASAMEGIYSFFKFLVGQ